MLLPGMIGSWGSKLGSASSCGDTPNPVWVPIPAMKSKPFRIPAAFASPSVGKRSAYALAWSNGVATCLHVL